MDTLVVFPQLPSFATDGRPRPTRAGFNSSSSSTFVPTGAFWSRRRPKRHVSHAELLARGAPSSHTGVFEPQAEGGVDAAAAATATATPPVRLFEAGADLGSSKPGLEVWQGREGNGG